MARARIYQLEKNPMQSGRARKKDGSWLLEFMPDSPYYIEPLMGWSGMADTTRELKLHFATQEEAVAYAQANQILFDVIPPHKRKTGPKSYADNFKFDRPEA